MGEVWGAFLACLETARLIAMRFRFETGSRQHLENESLQLTKKLCGLLLLRFMCLLFYSFLCSLQRKRERSPHSRPLPLPNSPQPVLVLYTVGSKGGGEPRELFLDLALLKVGGTLMLRRKKFLEFSTGCRKRARLVMAK